MSTTTTAPTTRTTRLGIALALGFIGPSGAISGAISVLIPAQLGMIDPAGKTAALGLVTLVGAAAAILANVVFGGLSDATRTRFGSRTPWVVGGAIASALTMCALSTAASVTAVLIWWSLFQIAANAVVVALTAVIPDRIAPSHRGVASTFIGAGVLIAVTIGSLIGAQFLTSPSTGFLVFGALALVLPLVFVAIAPDRSNREAEARALSLRQLASAFALPRNAPDSYWVLVGRFVIMLGYYAISSYQVYILQDYIGLDDAGTAAVIGTNALLTLAGAGIGVVVAGPLSDRIGSRKIPIAIGVALFVAAIAVPLLWPSAAAMMVFAGIGGLGFGAYYAVDNALMADVLPNPDTRAKDLGILNIANAGGQALAPVVASAVVAVAFPLLFVTAIAAVVLGGAAIAPIKSVR